LRYINAEFQYIRHKKRGKGSIFLYFCVAWHFNVVVSAMQPCIISSYILALSTMKNSNDSTRAACCEGFVSAGANAALFALKMWAAGITGSVALAADAWHTLSDSASSVVLIVAAKLSARKPDSEHPFGHGRWEQIAALLIAFLLGIIAFNLLRDAALRLWHAQSANFGMAAIVVTTISIAAKEMMAQYAFYLGRKTGSIAIRADGWHHRSDALSSAAVLLGIGLGQRFWWADSALGCVVALMLGYAVFKIARHAIAKILGEAPSPELTAKVADIARSVYHADLQMHHFHLHNYVRCKELTFHLKLCSHLTIAQGHRIATDIENAIYQQLGIAATIHVEPLGFEHEHD
jgi:cation diffusion facilitator family transporter